jgi:hypothetical protein
LVDHVGQEDHVIVEAAKRLGEPTSSGLHQDFGLERSLGPSAKRDPRQPLHPTDLSG